MNDHVSSLRLGSEFEVQDIRSPLTDVAWRLTPDRHLGAAEMFVLLAGGGAVVANGGEEVLAAPCVLWVPGRIDAEVRLVAGTRGARMRVLETALGRVVPWGGLPSSFRTALDRPMMGITVRPEIARRLAADLSEIEAETAGDLPGGREASLARLQLVLIALWRIGNSEPAETAASPRVLVQRFLQLVELNNRRHWRVAEYARALGISVDRLVSAIQRGAGVTPSELIHRRLIEDAQRLLAHSNLQVAEVGLTLGFKDPGYFNRFFTRRCGLPPGRYRTQVSRERTHASGSYAAWP